MIDPLDPQLRPGFAQRLEELLSTERNQVFLLLGPTGSGKRTCGRAIAARFLRLPLDEQPDYTEICGLDGKMIPVEQIRKRVCQDVSLSPRVGSYRVFLLEADALEEVAQNLLLKSLEEAPPYVRFILLASQPARILETVRSRSLQIQLPPLSACALKQIIQSESPEEWAQLAEERRLFLLRYAGGNPGRLLEALQTADFWDSVEAVAAAWQSLPDCMGRDLERGLALWESVERTQRHLDLTEFFWSQTLPTARAIWPQSQRVADHWDLPIPKHAALVRNLLLRLGEARTALSENVNRELVFTRLLLLMRKDIQHAISGRRSLPRRR